MLFNRASLPLKLTFPPNSFLAIYAHFMKFKIHFSSSIKNLIGIRMEIILTLEIKFKILDNYTTLGLPIREHGYVSPFIQVFFPYLPEKFYSSLHKSPEYFLLNVLLGLFWGLMPLWYLLSFTSFTFFWFLITNA